MKPELSRRYFLKTSLLGAAAGAVALRAVAAEPAKPAKPAAKPARKPFNPTADPAGLTAYQVGPQIWLRWNNRALASYRAHGSQKYPYVYPFAGPVTGQPLTSETGLPWPHHRSMFFGCDHINGADYWHPAGEELGKSQILSTGARLGDVTDTSATIDDTCEWRTEGQVVMKDRRRLVVTVAGPKLRFLDWEIEWTAVQAVTITKTNHSLFSIRAALDLVPAGGGQLVNAEGEAGEKGTGGKKSAWCACFGKRATLQGEVTEGIALFDHPKNPWSPCPWFTRDYGFVSPTPLFWIEKPLEMEAGKSFTLRYRIVGFAGTPQEANLAKLHKDWSA